MSYVMWVAPIRLGVRVMLCKKKNGSTLVIVIIVMAVLAILGTALLGVSLAETKHASRQDGKTQAHYIARSGTYVGIKMVNSFVDTNKYADLTLLARALNTEAGRLTINEKKVGDTGTFSLSFVVSEIGKLKIVSTGNTGGVQGITDTVTMSMDVNLPPPNTTNPTGWLPGNSHNLSHGANERDYSYIRSVINLDGRANTIKAPQGGGNNPVYQASAIKFIDGPKSGLCLEQINNTVPIIFDAQILYFESNVLLNSSMDSVKLTVSNTVLENWMIPNGTFINIASDPSGKQGFASEKGYKDFINGYDLDMYTSNNLNGRFGLAYFGGDIYRTINGNKTAKIYDSGWYYFKSGVDLQNIKSGELIPVNSNDAVIKAAQNLLSYKGGTSNQMWDKK